MYKYDNILPVPVEFDWDQGNIDKSLEKHGVSWKEAEDVFFSKVLKLRSTYLGSQAEMRYRALGCTNTGRVLTVVFTIRGHKIRVISARPQNNREKKEYEQSS